MIKESIVVLAMSVVSLPVIYSTATADTLWSNGDEVWGKAHSNEINTSVPYSIVYEDFVIPESDGIWNITSLWSYNYFTDSTPSLTGTAHWEIRSDVSVGEGGTLLFSGDSSATETFSSTLSTQNSYRIEIGGLDISLASGQYWFSVTPIGPGNASYNQIFLQGTSHENSVGGVTDGNAFWYTTSFGGKNFVSLENSNYSMGIGGTTGAPSAVPEPATMLLFGTGIAGLAGSRLRRKKK